MKEFDSIPTGPDWVYEPKWDGYHARLTPDGRVFSRKGRELTRFFPEIAGHPHPRLTLLGEIMANSWDELSRRVHPSRSRTETLRRTTPVQFMVYDVEVPGDFYARRRVLEVTPLGPHVLTPQTRDPQTAEWWRTEAEHLDGVVCRTGDATVKVKRRRLVDDTITGVDKVRRVVYLTRGTTATLDPRTFHIYEGSVGRTVEVTYDGQLHHGAYRGPAKIERIKLED